MDHRVELGHEETNIDVVLPGGQLIQLQYRLGEGPSIDICLPTECSVVNWEGDDMSPAPAVCEFNSIHHECGHEHVRLAKQLVIDLDPDWILED